jgi:hypothetical protein
VIRKLLRRVVQRFKDVKRAAVASTIRNGAFVGGLAAVFTGLWWERPSVALVAVGVILSASAAWSASR